MAIARIAENEIAEQRSDIALEDVPEHKRGQWKPIEGDPPSYNPALEVRTGPTYTIEVNRVLREWIVSRKSLDAQKLAVKAEAQRRIIVRTGASDLNTCFAKQLNAQMRATEITGKELAGEVLTAEETAEAAALVQLANDLKLIRSKSDEIEQMDPIPINYTDDIYWTQED